jgi:GH15 family glucan-1,4-alpha-glucosidase
LLHQEAFTDWSDTISLTGWVLYTNIVFWKALKDMSEAAAWIGRTDEREYYSIREAEVRNAIDGHFWRDDLGYYMTSEQFDNLSSSSNLLAIVWGLANRAQSNSILDTMKRFQMAEPVPTKPVHPPYPRHYLAIENRLSRLAFYHVDAAWLWLGALHAVALCRLDRHAEAKEVLYRLSKVILRDGIVHEVYHPDGRFVSNFWYTSEAPFTWSAGVLVFAHHVYHHCFNGDI